jgi:hypothetical protein
VNAVYFLWVLKVPEKMAQRQDAKADGRDYLELFDTRPAVAIQIVDQ